MLSRLRPVDYAGAVVFLALVGVVVFAAFGGFSDGKAEATFIGESNAEGANLFIDGAPIGVMRGKVVDGHLTPWLDTRVVLGRHHLVAVSARGDSIEMEYKSEESGSAGIAFPDSDAKQ